MKLFLENGSYIETSQPLDLSIPLRNDETNPRAWYVDTPRFEPVRSNGFLGSISEGGNVNFRDIMFNPHGHGTHTECLGHITKEIYSINKTIKQFFVKAAVISITPLKRTDPVNGNEDSVITKSQLEAVLNKIHAEFEALIVRTLPNTEQKCTKNYSATNPPYFESDVVDLLDELRVIHLLVDLPSVDRESDGGELAFHHRFWKVPQNENHVRTITELIFVPNEVEDGIYLLELQVAPFENDAAPSRPVIYRIQ